MKFSETCSKLWVANALLMSGVVLGCSIQKSCQLKVDAAGESWNLNLGMAWAGCKLQGRPTQCISFLLSEPIKVMVAKVKKKKKKFLFQWYIMPLPKMGAQ